VVFVDGTVGRTKVEWVPGLEGAAAWNVRVTPDGQKAVFLSAELGGPYAKTAVLNVLYLESRKVRIRRRISHCLKRNECDEILVFFFFCRLSQIEVIVPVVKTIDEDVKFAGIYGPTPMPRNCFVRNGTATTVVFRTPYLYFSHIYAVDIVGEKTSMFLRGPLAEYIILPCT
jgi:hypothetical protein